MREVESCFQRLEQRYALFTSGPARADRFLETVSPAPADVVRTTLFSVDSKAKNRPAHRKADTTEIPCSSSTRVKSFGSRALAWATGRLRYTDTCALRPRISVSFFSSSLSRLLILARRSVSSL